MATRFYFSLGFTTIVGPTVDLSWEGVSPSARMMNTSKRGWAFASSTKVDSVTTNPYDVVVYQLISEPLLAQTIAGNVKGIIRTMESSAAADMRAQMLIRVFNEIGTVSRGTLLAHDTAVLSNEFDAATLTNRKFPLNWTGSGAALTPVGTQLNDRLIIEVGFRATNAVSTSYTATFESGDASANDCAENETDQLQYNPWFEFDATIGFVDPASNRSSKREDSIDPVGLTSGRGPAYGGGSYAVTSSVGLATATSLLLSETTLGTNPYNRALPIGRVGATTYYKMRARDAGAGYVTWIAGGSPDFAGVGYATGSPAPVGAMVGGSAVVAASWEV